MGNDLSDGMTFPLFGWREPIRQGKPKPAPPKKRPEPEPTRGFGPFKCEHCGRYGQPGVCEGCGAPTVPAVSKLPPRQPDTIRRFETTVFGDDTKRRFIEVPTSVVPEFPTVKR